jgi:hypothetical protein
MFSPRKEKSSEQEPKAAGCCAFCNRSQADVSRLIAGPTVMICDDCVRICVRICVDIIADAELSEPPETLEAAREQRSRLQAARANADGSADAVPDEMIPLWHVRCALCRQIVATETAFSIEGRGVLCDSCLTAAQQIRRHRREGDEGS